MNPIYCHQCGRANGAVAKRCIWCGVPILDESNPGKLDTTRVEIGYLNGIDRLEDAGPVNLTVSAEGVEISELVPGTRSVLLPASSILEATTVDASTMAEGKRQRAAWWRLGLGSLASAKSRRMTSDTKKHDYVLTIAYSTGSQTRYAMFHREDEAGRAVVEGLARIVSALVRDKTTG